MDLAQSNEIFTIANESQQAFKACMAKKNSWDSEQGKESNVKVEIP
jgi:hypothetical protein